MTVQKKPLSTWAFEEGTLTVTHLGQTVSLGRYATREFAAKAAAAYFEKHTDPAVPTTKTMPSLAVGGVTSE